MTFKARLAGNEGPATWMVAQELSRKRRHRGQFAAKEREEEDPREGLWQDLVSLREAFGLHSE